MNEVDFYIAVDDTSDPLEVRLKSDDGSIIDLTGASVSFKMKQVGSDTTKVDADPIAEGSGSTTGIVFDDASNGDVTYAWQSGDTDTAGYYNARFYVDYDGDTGSDFDADQSFPNVDYLTIKVDDDAI
jgi:hypothetical protein